MKKISKTFTIALSIVLMVMMVACNNATSMSIQEHYENNRFVYEELANKVGGKSGTVSFTVDDNSLVLTSTLSVAVKKGQEHNIGKVMKSTIEGNDDVYYEVLENIRKDVPDATFVVKFVDKNFVELAKKEYK